MLIPDEIRGLAGKPFTPFIGAGLARDAGVPAGGGLAQLLAAEGSVDGGHDLAAVTRALESQHGQLGAQDVVRRVIRGLAVNTTPALKALAGACRGSVILTTNYDDAIEMSAKEIGLTARPFELSDAQAYAPPGADEVAVVHVHGRAATGGPLILPGVTTMQLTGAPVYQGLVASFLAPHPVVYLGFRLDPSEGALLAALDLLGGHIQDAAPHYLLLSSDVAVSRSDLQWRIDAGLLTVLTYDDPTHAAVSEIAQFLAPRTEVLGDTMSELVGPEPEGYLTPRIFSAALQATPRELDQMTVGVDYGFSDTALPAQALIDATRALLVASPGMGKSELLAHLARETDQPAAVLVDLKSVASHLGADAEPELAVVRALQDGTAGREGTPLPDRDALEQNSYLLLLDSLDEVSSRRSEVVACVLAAVVRWPQHRWIVASRPIEDCVALVGEGFAPFRLWPSSAWGSAYLDKRAIDNAGRRALQDAGGFDDLISIPLFAAAAADRLIAGTLPARPLDLLVELQRAAALAEQRQAVMSGSLFAWVRRLGVGLELRGRSAASIDELAEVAGPEAPPGKELRESLITATLLAELPDQASFQRKTFQEALCADAVLANSDVATALASVAQAEVAGQQVLRSDIEFTIDLVYENGTREQRAELRAMDPMRWARTVITSGNDEDADAAFTLIWDGLIEQRRFAYRFADNLIRSERRAIGAIGRKWPDVVARRRDELIAMTRSEHPSDRYNAIVALASPGRDPDSAWHVELLCDENGSVARAAVSAVRGWADPAMAGELWTALQATELASDVWPDLVVALAELARSPEDFERVAVTADKRANLLGRLLGYLVSEMTREQIVGLLPRWPSQGDLRRAVIEQLLEADDAWSDDEFAALMKSLISHRLHLSDLVALPSLREAMVERADVVLGVLTQIARVRVSGDHSIFAVLWALGPDIREASSHPELTGYVDELDDHVEAYPPPIVPVSWSARLAQELDDGDIDEEHPWAETHWPPDLDERHLIRLQELSQAWWPESELATVHRYAETAEEERTVAAVSAGAAANAPLSREHWLELVGAFALLELVPAAHGWLADRYEPEWEEGLLDVVSRAPDGRALSSIVAAVSQPSERLIDAVVDRLRQLGDGSWSSNALGLLADHMTTERLRALLDDETAYERRRTLLQILADRGDGEAQAEVLENLLARARAGKSIEGVSWKQSVSEPRVVELLGDLILALPYVPRRTGTTYGREPRGAAEGMLAVAETEAAVAVYDRLIAEDHSGRHHDLARYGLMRRLAARAVLQRLPTALGDAADVLLARAGE